MEDVEQFVYIIDTYSRFTNDIVVSTFFVNGKEYSIKKVRLEWGVPQLSSIEEESERPYFQLYNTLDEAREFVRKLKRLEGARY